ncbi:MAG: hypothetical protein MK066_09555 [Crocinitomicaceae bacterium]|nr:hypothetical protein [Crocinitomicaceae bacterium]
MKKSALLILVILGFVNASYSQDNKHEKDRNAIKSMCGCYEVGFNFSETFSYSEDSTYIPSKKKQVGALEWAELVEDSEGKIVIQHLLIVGDPTNPMIIKHWRQDWTYENTEFYMYNGDNQWNYETKSADEVKGQWTQQVFQVDDSPRYEGSATWVHVDGKSFWENTTDAPLPRREYTQRSDYNVTVRRNRHEITENGWIHDQDNDKIVRIEGKADQLIAQEKGYNTYVRVEKSKCQAAQNWWKDNHAFWAEARKAWDDVYGRGKSLELASKVEGKHLYELLFAMDVATKPKKITKTIESFIK